MCTILMDQEYDDYVKITGHRECQSYDTKLPDATQTKRHSLPAKPIPLPKPKVNKMPSTEPVTQRKERLPIPLPRNEGNKPLPSVPTTVETDLPENQPVSEEHTVVANITSKPYSLETFYKEYQLPQIVSVVGGHLGVTEEYSMSEGEELVLFFAKSSQVVIATPNRNKSEWYYIPLNSSLQFVPYDSLVKGEEQFEQFKTVEDLLNRKGDLPKVVKVSKTYDGKSPQLSVVAGELIFPKKVSVSFRRKKTLECLNSKNKLLKLEPTCEGNFSINPADVKLYLVELLHYFQDFPITATVINDHVGRSKSCSLTTGTVLSLGEPKQLQTYICSTDVLGKMNYPLMELPMSMPIEIQCIEYPNFDMKPIYSKIQHTYENFKPSLISKNMFNAQSTSMLATQQALYEEIHHDDNTTNIYDLEKPSLIYDSIPAQFTCSNDVGDKNIYTVPTSSAPIDPTPRLPPTRRRSADMHPPISQPIDQLVGVGDVSNKNIYTVPMSSANVDPTPLLPPTRRCSTDMHPPMSQSFEDTGAPLPPLPPPRNSLSVSKRASSTAMPIPPTPSTKSDNVVDNVTPHNETVPLNTAFSPGSNEEPTVAMPSLQVSDNPLVTTVTPKQVVNQNSTSSIPSTENVLTTTAYVGGSKEENVAYLKSFSLDSLLQLLENMNLGQYKDNFENEQIDGEMIVHLEREDLVDLGVDKSIHQTRLLKLIDGSVSAKKYEDGGYATLKRKQSMP